MQEHATQKIAVLFTDMKGSTSFYKKHGNLAGRIMIQKLYDMLFPIVKQHGGTVVKTIGDAVMAYFFSAGEALLASIAMQMKLAEYNKDHDEDDQLLIKIAINYGYGIIEKNDVFGDVVNIAGKIISYCDARSIIVSGPVYEAVEEASPVAFHPFQLDGRQSQLKDLSLYTVDWETGVTQRAAESLFLLSLSCKSSGFPERSRRAVADIFPAIKQHADRIVDAGENGINATFRNMTVCLETAQQALQKMLDFTAATSEPPCDIKVGLHVLEDTGAEEDNFRDGFEEALRACTNAGSYEIVVSDRLYQLLSRKYKKACIQKHVPAEKTAPLYILHWQGLGEGKSVLTSLIPEDPASVDAPSCFYCGSSRHQTGLCPSKYIRTATNCLERLAYVPFKTLQQVFYENFNTIVQPITKGSDEKQFEILSKEASTDPYALAFFSYYEIFELFQLRSLHDVYLESTDKGKKHAKPRELRLGEECLRVSRLSESEEWFHKAIKEYAHDYRPHVALGIVAMEGASPEKALSHFRKALSFSLSDMQKCYIGILTARVYEVAGSLSHAKKEVEEVLRIFHTWPDIKYYHGVLLAKLGHVDDALRIFSTLVRQSPRYFLMVFLNPELQCIKNELILLLNRHLSAIRARSGGCLEKITKIIQEADTWLDREGADYTKAHELYQKACGFSRDESLAGLLDIEGIEITITTLARNSLDKHRNSLRKKLGYFKNIADQHAEYLVCFPYRNVVSRKDVKLDDDFRTLLDTAKKIVDIKTVQSLKRADALMERLSKESERLLSNRKRLELIKRSFFVGECSLKTALCFMITTAMATAVCTLVLLLYQAYEHSLSAMSSPQFLNYLKFGFYAGLAAGGAGTGVWIKKNFADLYKKIES